MRHDTDERSPSDAAARPDARPPAPDDQAAAQRDELDDVGAVGPSMPAIPESMTRGATFGIGIGALVGAVILSPFSAIPFFEMAFGARLLIAVIVGAVAGAAVGAVFFAGANAELDSDSPTGDRDVLPEHLRRR